MGILIVYNVTEEGSVNGGDHGRKRRELFWKSWWFGEARGSRYQKT